MRYIKDSGLESILNGKRVALVGPAPHLEGKNHGPEIDAYDVICRVNEVFPFELEKDYGSRTDIIFLCLNNQSVPILKKQFARNLDVTRRIKYVVCPKDNNPVWSRFFGLVKVRMDCDIAKNWEAVNAYHIPFHHVGDDYCAYLEKKEIKGETNTGVLAIIVLLQYPLKELLITGFSFYHGKEKYRYHTALRSIYTEPDIKHPILNLPHGSKQKIQTQYLKKKIIPQHKNTIVVDSHINKILRLKHPRVFEL